MPSHHLTRRSLHPDDEPERLSADDMATRREEEFLALSLQQLARRAAASPGPTGVCANCGACCLPQARYCDEDCREDHEHRERVLSRLRGRR